MSWMATGANSKELLPTKRANLRVAAAAEGVLGVAAAVVAVAAAVPGPPCNGWIATALSVCKP